MAKFTKQPAKIGDKVILFVAGRSDAGVGPGFTAMKPYKVVATSNSKEINRICFNRVCPRKEDSRFVVFVTDDDGDKRYLAIGTDCFGITVEKLNENPKRSKS